MQSFSSTKGIAINHYLKESSQCVYQIIPDTIIPYNSPNRNCSDVVPPTLLIQNLILHNSIHIMIIIQSKNTITHIYNYRVHAIIVVLLFLDSWYRYSSVLVGHRPYDGR